MDLRALLGRKLLVSVALCLLAVPIGKAAEEPTLTKEQIREFLLTAKIIGAKSATKGITHTYRLTLTDGKLTHDAHFQPVEVHKTNVQMASGHSEINFVDSYKYNIAAYTLAEMLGVDDMLPMYVERKYKGDSGSLSWWLPVKMDEAERLKQKVAVPDPDAWNNQMYRIRVFDQLVYDDDPNLTNLLIGADWKIWRVDFTRGFRLHKDLRDPKDLVRCDRRLLEKLKTLDGNELAAKTKHYLSNDEVKAVMARRDKIVARFQQLISEQGEAAVLY
jgi:hypothetical protein